VDFTQTKTTLQLQEAGYNPSGALERQTILGGFQHLKDRQFFEDHIGLLKSIVSSFDKSCNPVDSEFFPIACIGMIKAISTFDSSKSKFSYWATKIINNSILQEIRKTKPLPKPLPNSNLDDLPLDSQNSPLDLIPLLTNDCGNETHLELENKRMLVRHYLDGVSMAEIAREVGLTRERIRQKVNKAIEFIRKKHAKILDNHLFWLDDKV
jgi:DNA-directed RNA polymerase specialized sigma subunit